MEQKGLQFEMSIDPDVWRYWIGDAERLQQMLLNLIGNSVKFTAQGKIEVVRSLRKPDEDGQRGAAIRGDRYRLRRSPRKGRLIFEAFQQAEGSMNRPYEGTGLGLAIAKTLVEMMSGRIWLEPQNRTWLQIRLHGVSYPQPEEAVRDKKSGVSRSPGAQQTGSRHPDPAGGRQPRKHDSAARVPGESSALAGLRHRTVSKR